MKVLITLLLLGSAAAYECATGDGTCDANVAPLGASKSCTDESCTATAIDTHGSSGATLLAVDRAVGKQKDAQECPDWCLEDRFDALSWGTKCWTARCHACPAWQENCGDVVNEERRFPILCADWCLTWLTDNDEKRAKREVMMCKWAKCQGCDAFANKCGRREEEEVSMVAEQVPAIDTQSKGAAMVAVSGAVSKQRDAQECPDWCLEPRFDALSWGTRCWTSRCHACPAWQENCADVVKQEEKRFPILCADWCLTWLTDNDETRAKREDMMCKWVNCQGCEAFVHKCGRQEEEEAA